MAKTTSARACLLGRLEQVGVLVARPEAAETARWRLAWRSLAKRPAPRCAGTVGPGCAAAAWALRCRTCRMPSSPAQGGYQTAGSQVGTPKCRSQAPAVARRDADRRHPGSFRGLSEQKVRLGLGPSVQSWMRPAASGPPGRRHTRGNRLWSSSREYIRRLRSTRLGALVHQCTMHHHRS